MEHFAGYTVSALQRTLDLVISESGEDCGVIYNSWHQQKYSVFTVTELSNTPVVLNDENDNQINFAIQFHRAVIGGKYLLMV